jgi:serpin B
MVGIQKARYGETESLQSLELAYVGRSISMLILLPKQIDGLDELEASLSVKNLAKWRAGLRTMKVRIILPKFKMTSSFRLDQILQTMGMIDLFRLPGADLAGMTGKPDLYVDGVIHKAYVEVNEKGTEAAAATGVYGSTKSRGPSRREPPIFRADHPFFFIIQENLTGSILFMGRVVDPSVSS